MEIISIVGALILIAAVVAALALYRYAENAGWVGEEGI